MAVGGRALRDTACQRIDYEGRKARLTAQATSVDYDAFPAEAATTQLQGSVGDAVKERRRIHGDTPLPNET
jgi:hypothetical protein